MKALKVSQIMEKMIAFSGKSFEKSGRGASGKPYPFGCLLQFGERFFGTDSGKNRMMSASADPNPAPSLANET